MPNQFDNDGFLSKRKQSEVYFANMIKKGFDKFVETITGGILPIPPVELTMKDIVSYAFDRQLEYPEIVSTRIAYFEQQDGEKVFAQTMLNEKGESVFADAEKQNFVGRIFPKSTTISQEIKDLLADNVDCIIKLPELELTFKDVVQWGQNAKKNNPKVSAVRFTRFIGSAADKQSYVLTALDSTGKEIFADTEKKTVLGKNYPHTTKINGQLKELLEDDVTCIIPLE